MKYPIFLLLLVLSCSTTKPPIPNPAPKPPPEVVVFDTTHIKVVVNDTTTVNLSDTVHLPPFVQSTSVPIGLADYAPYFQRGIDSCINNYIPFYYLPAGRYPMKEPLILQHTINNTYVFFTIQLIGAGTAGESDGSGTILDWTLSPGVAFGIGVQDGKGVIIRGIKLWGAFNYKFPGAYQFYNTPLSSYTDGVCRDKPFSPYSGIVIDPFGPSIPSDGGFPGTDAYGVSLGAYYRSTRSGSTGIHVTECFLTNWVVDIITSPNGSTQNADNLTFDFLQLGNSKIGIAGCQDQEKNNTVSHVQEWGVMHTCFTTGLYGAGSIGSWFLDHWNIAGYTNQIIYNKQSGYFPTYIDNFYAESIARIGFIGSMNGSKISNSTINFAGYLEAGSYTSDMISGFGVTFDGCQLRLYGQFSPVTIATGAGANNMHFINCSFDCIPVYPQTYGTGYSDFLNCYVGASTPANVLNPLGPSVPSIYAYPTTSNVAAKNVPLDGLTHKLTNPILSDSAVTLNEPIVGTFNFVDYKIIGVVTAINKGGFTLSYAPAGLDSTKTYNLYHWITLKK